MTSPVIIGHATLDPCIGNDPNWPEPESRHFADPRFDQIWEAIKMWDIEVRGKGGREGATGNHVRAILDALDGATPPPAISSRIACNAASGLRR